MAAVTLPPPNIFCSCGLLAPGSDLHRHVCPPFSHVHYAPLNSSCMYDRDKLMSHLLRSAIKVILIDGGGEREAGGGGAEKKEKK